MTSTITSAFSNFSLCVCLFWVTIYLPKVIFFKKVILTEEKTPGFEFVAREELAEHELSSPLPVGVGMSDRVSSVWI